MTDTSNDTIILFKRMCVTHPLQQQHTHSGSRNEYAPESRKTIYHCNSTTRHVRITITTPSAALICILTAIIAAVTNALTNHSHMEIIQPPAHLFVPPLLTHGLHSLRARSRFVCYRHIRTKARVATTTNSSNTRSIWYYAVRDIMPLLAKTFVYLIGQTGDGE